MGAMRSDAGTVRLVDIQATRSPCKESVVSDESPSLPISIPGASGERLSPRVCQWASKPGGGVVGTEEKVDGSRGGAFGGGGTTREDEAFIPVDDSEPLATRVKV